jgi:HPt (histidine-containing phosphotransfer) domain-containing protein
MFNTGGFMVMVDFNVLGNIAIRRQDQIEILFEFQAQNWLDLEELNASLQLQDIEAVRRGAHRIKGASRMVGAVALESVCEKIEAAAKQKCMIEAMDAARALEGVVIQLDSAIKQFAAADRKRTD